MADSSLEILFSDHHFVAVNKPPGLMVHRTAIASNAGEYALQMLRNQINQRVYPCHRLDRKTSGVLLFAKSPDANSAMQKLFAENRVKKTYLAVVRGFTDTHGIIDYPLLSDDGKLQEAVTHFSTLSMSEIPIAFGKHASSRYALLEVKPQTGRTHQIRKHLAHIFHPIIGDRPHGCNKQNKLFKEKWNMTSMLLHAQKLEFTHPFSGDEIHLNAPLNQEFSRMIAALDFKFTLESF